ncbi:MAG: hypothetical protein IJA34_17235 [Lachnospiraceae bacterium]|nr:hypothetical protein [Lachnospiraceae bacterium]
MSNTPKIMVFRLKELIYTAIFILLAILLIVFLVKMFNSDKKGHDNNNETVNAEASKSEGNNEENTVPIENLNNNTSEIETSKSDINNTETDNTTVNPTSENNSSSSSIENTSPETAPPKKTPKRNYSPGVYTSSLVLNNSALEVQVSVDLDSINSISIKNMDEAITTMYPLMSGSIKDLEKQIIASQSLENITYSSENRYTYMVLLDAISSALSKAEKSN